MEIDTWLKKVYTAELANAFSHLYKVIEGVCNINQHLPCGGNMAKPLSIADAILSAPDSHEEILRLHPPDPPKQVVRRHELPELVLMRVAMRRREYLVEEGEAHHQPEIEQLDSQIQLLSWMITISLLQLSKDKAVQLPSHMKHGCPRHGNRKTKLVKRGDNGWHCAYRVHDDYVTRDCDHIVLAFDLPDDD